jgi:phage-related minor tail protein
VAQDNRPDREWNIHQAKSRAQRNAGDDAGQAIGRMTKSEMVSRPKNFDRDTAAASMRAEHQRDDRGNARDLDRQPQRFAHVRTVPGNAEPLRCQAWRRENVGFVFRGEGIKEDQKDREMHERKTAGGGEFQPEWCLAFLVRAHRKPPSVWQS